LKKPNAVCQIRIEAFSTKISSRGVLEYTASIYFFEILKCFFRNKSLFFKNKFTHKGDNSEYIESKEVLFPIAIKIKLLVGLIPTDEIALEICKVIAKRIKISVSILLDSKILFLSALIEIDKIFFK
jgi:hypothetical protein